MAEKKKLIPFKDAGGSVCAGFHEEYGPVIFDCKQQLDKPNDEWRFLRPQGEGFSAFYVKKDLAATKFMTCRKLTLRDVVTKYLQWRADATETKPKKSISTVESTIQAPSESRAEAKPQKKQKAKQPPEQPKTTLPLLMPGSECWACGATGKVGKRKCTECKGTGKLKSRPNDAFQEYGAKPFTHGPGHIYKDDNDGNRVYPNYPG